MKKTLLIILAILLLAPLTASAIWWNPLTWFGSDTPTLGAVYQTFQRSLIPVDSTENIGTSTALWDYGYFNNLIVSGLGGSGTRCVQVDTNGLLAKASSACGSGGGGSGGGTWATTTSNVSGQLINYPLNDTDIVTIGNSATTSAEFWFDPNTFVSYLKGNVGIGTTSPYAALSVVGASGVVAGKYTATSTVASTFPYASTTALTVSGNSYLGTVSLGTWNGTAIDISDYTNLTAGDALTLTGDDIDFDGGASPAGDLGGTWASPTVDDDSHAHTGTTLSGIDISDDTNLSGDTEIVLTGDALSIASTIARDTELHAAVTLAGEDYLSLSTQQITANAIDADNLSATDFGGFTCNGTTCSIDNATISGVALGSNLNSLSNDATLVGTSYNGSAPVNDWGIDLTNPNSWTGLQTFANATSTLLSSSYASTTALVVGNSFTFGGVTGNSWDDFCTTITGSADLCDGGDAEGAGGSIDGAGIAGMMTSWTDSNTVQATSTIIGEQFIATSSSKFNRFAGTTTVPSLQVGPTAITNNGLKLSIPTGMTISSSESAGGLFNCNTGTTDAPCAVLYRNTTGTTRNVSIVDDAATFGGNSLHVRNDGTESAFNILCAGILGKGCGKLTIQNVSDADASQLSLDASSAGYLGQGIFVDCTGGSCDATNNALSIANESGTNGMALTLKWGGKMGIGTTSPYAALSVAGDTGVVANKYHATSTTATSTFAGGLSAASSLYVLQNGNVGVSTGAAQYPLHVEKAAAGAVGYFKNTSAWGGAEYGLHVDGYSNLGGVRVNGGDGPRVFYLASGQLGFGANNNAITFESQISQEMMRIHTNGFVGIGTTSPYAALSVVGATGVVAGKYTATSTATSTFAGGIDAARVCLTGTTTCLSATGGSGTPGGSDTQVQFNDGGAFGGAVGVVWKKLTGLLGVGTTTPQWLATFSTSTAPQIGITTGAGIAGWAIRNDNAAHLTISTTSPTTFATSTNPLFELRGEAGTVSSFEMATSSTASASSTIIMGKLQFDGYDSAGVRRCVMWNGGAWSFITGACTQ